VLLVQQRDTIKTARLVASIDQVNQGRFVRLRVTISLEIAYSTV
jgi:hypothetical protein